MHSFSNKIISCLFVSFIYFRDTLRISIFSTIYFQLCKFHLYFRDKSRSAAFFLNKKTKTECVSISLQIIKLIVYYTFCCTHASPYIKSLFEHNVYNYNEKYRTRLEFTLTNTTNFHGEKFDFLTLNISGTILFTLDHATFITTYISCFMYALSMLCCFTNAENRHIFVILCRVYKLNERTFPHI